MLSATERYPRISTSFFPDREAEAIGHLSLALSSLNSYVINFEAALALFDFCGAIRAASGVPPQGPLSDRIMLMSWRFLAARDGAMTIFHFGKTLQAIRRFGFSNCPTFKAKLDHAQLRIGEKLFRQWFPDFEKVRHSVAHSAELSRDSKSHMRNSVRGVLIRDVLNERNFQNSYAGRVLSYDIDTTTLLHLKSVRNRVYAAFWPFDSSGSPNSAILTAIALKLNVPSIKVSSPSNGLPCTRAFRFRFNAR